MIVEKKAQTSVAVHDIISRRWSPRAFDSSKPLSRGQVMALLEAARWAPSCFGDEPWRYLVWDRNRDPGSWQEAFECLSEGNQAWVKNVPLLLASIASSQFARNGKPNRWGQHDTGAASANLVLQAVALGLAAHQMGGFNVDMLRERFAIPNGFTPMAMIAVGYQADVATLEGEFKERELATRTRRPLGEKFFEGKWDVPVA